MTIYERLREIGVVPVVEIADPAVAGPLADTLLRCGIPCLEITFRTAAAAAAIAVARETHPDVLIGAGTVINVDQLRAAIEAGAQFIVSPGFGRSVVERCVADGIPVLPGVMTASEVQLGIDAGLSVLKLYPVELAGGVKYLQALGAPFPGVTFMPSGGIDGDRLEAYLVLPNVIAVGGSWFVKREWLARGDMDAVASAATAAATVVRRVRGTTG